MYEQRDQGMLRFLVISNIFGLVIWSFLVLVTIIPTEIKSDLSATFSPEELRLELWSQKMSGFYEGFGWGMSGASVMLLINLVNLLCIYRLANAQVV
ncbi:MAG: hypothetical protein NVV73_07850 [Cellvibrionaceae bacterium]|nr:hypothetical protein [Cellvibrionaceae bacterium]